MLCLDAKTGKLLWIHEYPVVYRISYAAGPRSTPVIDGGLVYTIGAMGDMFCLDAKSGEVKWKKNFVEDFGTPIPNWGMVASPLVEGDQLITLVGGENSLIVSFDKTTGKELWRSLDDPEVGYCPPVIFTFGKTRQLIVWHPRAVSSLNPENGKVNWEIPFRVRAGLTIPTPRKIGNRLFVTSFYNGSRMIEVADDGQSAKIVWQGHSENELPDRTDGLHSIMATPVVTETNIYGIVQLRGAPRPGCQNRKTAVGNLPGHRQRPLVERVSHPARRPLFHPQRARRFDHRQPHAPRLRRNQPGQARRTHPPRPPANDHLVPSGFRDEKRVREKRQRNRAGEFGEGGPIEWAIDRIPIDSSLKNADDEGMSEQHTLPAEVEADMQAVMEALHSGRRMDEETYRRIRERAEKVRDELKKQHGEMEIAVDLIRQTRDDA